MIMIYYAASFTITEPSLASKWFCKDLFSWSSELRQDRQTKTFSRVYAMKHWLSTWYCKEAMSRHVTVTDFFFWTMLVGFLSYLIFETNGPDLNEKVDALSSSRWNTDKRGSHFIPLLYTGLLYKNSIPLSQKMLYRRELPVLYCFAFTFTTNSNPSRNMCTKGILANPRVLWINKTWVKVPHYKYFPHFIIKWSIELMRRHECFLKLRYLHNASDSLRNSMSQVPQHACMFV